MDAHLLMEGASPLEKLLVERVVLCWLRLQFAEQYATLTMLSGLTFVEIEYIDKQLERAQRWYLNALQSLARVRKRLPGWFILQPSPRTKESLFLH